MPQYTWEIAPCQEGAGFTLREKESGQLMHSTLGPWVEANLVYVGQSELDRRSLVIYDIGLGIAANSLAVLEALDRLPNLPQREVQIFSFERSPEALVQALQSPERFGFISLHLDKLRSLLEKGSWSSADSRIQWKLITGDFREAGLSGLPKADLIYFDFYAPAVCPELWTYAIFSKLYAQMKSDPLSKSLLITYASNKAVRAAMLLAGFFVGDGVTTPIKSETTVASPTLAGLKNPIGRAWLAGFDKSPKQLPADWPESRREEALRAIHAHLQFKR
jgi:tRNA U34 5-methylaminomethyl-2-thiouridine-forming methyltransferase MnmC